MDSITLRVQKEQDHRHATVVVAGEVDLVNCGHIEPSQILNGLEIGAVVHVDLTGVTFIDSSGIMRVLQLQRDAQALGIRVACYVQEQSLVHRVLKLIGATDVLTVIPIPMMGHSEDTAEGPAH